MFLSSHLKLGKGERMMKVDVYGEGPTVVLLHGCPVPPESLRPIWEYLRGSYRVVVPDLTGLGVGLVESLGAIELALKAHGVKDAALIGHSLGAYRAFQLARSGVIDVTRIVGLGPIAHFSEETLTQFAAFADEFDVDTSKMSDMALGGWYSLAFKEANPDLDATVNGWFHTMGEAVISQALRTEFAGPDLHPVLHEIDVPVYLRVGSLDITTPAALAEAIAALLPDARLDIAQGAAHFLHDEEPETALFAVESFLRGG